MTEITDKLDLSTHAWLCEPALQRLLDVVHQGGGEARPVGGAVRDALLGRKVAEIDIAVNLEPSQLVALLTKAGIKTVPTGIDHGTITAVVDHKGYEMTSLRRDIESDGRRAKVSFTKDWAEDAARRDFTMNALYVDAQGIIYDYTNGRQDLARGHVRFIGDPHERIKEDVLRILRFFRFHAWFGRGDIDQAGLEACTQMASLLPQLSIERVWREIAKLLAAANPLPTWQLMLDCFILPRLLPEVDHADRLRNLLAVETKTDLPPSYLARLAALLPKHEQAAIDVAQRLKMSNKEAQHLKTLATLPDLLLGKLDPVPFRRMLYKHGAQYMRDALVLHAADHGDVAIEQNVRLAAEWVQPQLPVQGDDVVKLGVAPGPRVGEILRMVEEWWMSDDFHADRAACLTYLASVAK